MISAPETFGPYRLVRRLAFGGMAEIFLAVIDRGAGFEKRVVLKRILPQFSADPGFVQMFIDEAVVAGRLSHPNVVEVHDFGNVEGVYFMTMEYVDGADLRQILREGDARGRQLSFAETAAIGESVARGLAYAHDYTDDRLGPLGIVHRDISPHNIMLSRAGDVRVMDFGIAKAAARATRTAIGTLKGKVAYMAPEQAAGHPIDGRCDQFALGVVLWECLSGRRLFEGTSDLDLLRRVLACEVRPLAEVRPDVPPALTGVVMRMLAASPEERYPSMREVEQELASYRFSLGQSGAVQLGRMVDDLVQRIDLPRGRGTEPLPEATGPPGRDGAAASGDTMSIADGELATSATSLEPTRLDREVDRPTTAAVYGHGGAADRRPARRVVGVAVVVSLGVLGATGWLVAERRTLGGGAPLAAVTLIQVDSEPAGAQILIDGVDVGLTTPAVVPGPTSAPGFELELRRAGYVAWHTRIGERSPSPVRAQLLPATAGPAAAVRPRGSPAAADPGAPLAIAPPPEAGGERRADPSPAPRRVSASPAEEKEAEPAAAGPPGRLSVRSAGTWFDVYLDGDRLGTTPLEEVEVPAGALRLRIVNGPAGIDRVIAVEVPAGGNVRRTIKP